MRFFLSRLFYLFLFRTIFYLFVTLIYFSYSSLICPKNAGIESSRSNSRWQHQAAGSGLSAQTRGKHQPRWTKVSKSLFAFRSPSFLPFRWIYFVFFRFFYSLFEEIKRKRAADEESCYVRSSCIDLIEDGKTWCDLLDRWHEVMA